MNVAVIIPATRVSVVNTLHTIPMLNWIKPVVVVDGNRAVLDVLPDYVQHIYLPERHNDWGAYARNAALCLVDTEWITFMDDDDCYVPGAFDHIASAMSGQGIALFRARDLRNGRLYWDVDQLVEGNVTTQCYLIPNIKGKIGRFTTRYGHDYDFIVDTAALQGGLDKIRWLPEVICGLRYTRRDDPCGEITRYNDRGIANTESQLV